MKASLLDGKPSSSRARRRERINQPACAFNLPPMTLDLKAAFRQHAQDWPTIDEHPLLMRLIARLGKDVGVPAQKVFDPVNERTSVGVISKEMARTREASDHLRQEQARSIAVTDVRCVNQDSQDQALGIDEQVPFATPDFFLG